VLEFDSPAFGGGVAEYAAEPTGCTVFHSPAGAALAIDVPGDSPAYIEAHGWTHAICLGV
jgi:hypothetical protein